MCLNCRGSLWEKGSWCWWRAKIGLRLTPQREVLLRVLSKAMGHPTADDMVQRVRKVLPTVSAATVYRNLQELVREGLIRTLEVAGTAVQ